MIRESFIVVSAVFIFTSLVGCAASNYQPSVNRSSAQAFTVTKQRSASEDNTEIEKKLHEVLEFCQLRLSGYEIKSLKQARTAYWLSMSGLVAGAVISPALAAANASGNAAGIAALSGWAGATNFAGEALRSSGLSGTTIAQTRNEITRAVKDAVAIASDSSKSFDERKGALIRARAECILYEIAVPTIPNNS